MDVYHVLVIVLAVLLGIFLILSIVIAVLLIQLVKYLRHVSEQAANVMDNVENVGEFFRRSAGPMAMAKMLGVIVEGFTNRKHGHKGD